MNRPGIRSLQALPSHLSSSCWRRAAAWTLPAALVGCATSACPPFRAAWYLDETAEAAATSRAAASGASAASAVSAASAPTVLLALVNEGSQNMVLSRVVVNPTDGDAGKIVYSSSPEPPAPGHRLVLVPGEMKLFAVNDPTAACVLPVAVRLHCGDAGRSHTQAVSGSLPNYLHSSWITSCWLKQTK